MQLLSRKHHSSTFLLHQLTFQLPVVAILKMMDSQKDAGYITELFLPHITEAEEKSPQCTDLVIFDGASNVQKAGLLLEAKFPHLSVMHGAEHVISLFYSDVFKIRQHMVVYDKVCSCRVPDACGPSIG